MTITSTKESDTLGVLGVLIAAFLWGTTGTAATFAPNVGPLAIGAMAMGVGGLLQVFIAARGIQKHHLVLKANKSTLLIGAIAVAIYPLAFYASMHYAGVTVGTVISLGAAPLVSALIERILDKQHLKPRWFLGAAVGISGILLISLAESDGHSTLAPNPTLGVILGLVAALTYSLYSWAARHIIHCGVPSRTAMGAIFGIGGILLMPVLLVTGAPLIQSWNNAAVGIYMALVPMFIGYVCFGYGLARIKASIATTITLFEPVVAAILAVLIIGESLSLSGWLGIALVLACLVIISLPSNKR